MQNDIDAALYLKMNVDKGIKLGDENIMNLLKSSELINELTADFIEKPLYAVWRIIALSEIPYTERLEYTRRVVQYIIDRLSTPSGFTLTGKVTDLLPCYNSMLVEALSKLGYADTASVQNAVTWIKRYQLFERNASSAWDGKGIQKYGGCLKSTPCFIGVAKAVKALLRYNEAINGNDKEAEALISKGTAYILRHKLYKRLSDHQPINRHITNLAFPASYQLNIVELLEIAHLTGNIRHPNCREVADCVIGKRTKDGFWKTNYVYKADGYVSFDQRGRKGDWLTYLIEKYLEPENE